MSDSLSIILTNLGHNVISYPDAESLFRSTPPDGGDTVVVDLSLPGISGAQVVRWLLKLAAVPRVVVITGQSQSAIEHQLRGLKPAMLVRKPLDVETLAQAIPLE